jgi:hypothetical protein
VSDLFEKLAGTSPSNPKDAPPEPIELSADRLQARLSFNVAKKDTLSLLTRLTVPNPDFKFDGIVVSIQVGELERSNLVLNAKGKAASGASVLTVKRAAPRSSSLIVLLAIKNSELKNELGPSGLVNKNTLNDQLTIPVGVGLNIGGEKYVFNGDTVVTYKAIKGKTGTAKRSQ